MNGRRLAPRLAVLCVVLVLAAPNLAGPLDPAQNLTSDPRLAPLPDGGFVAVWHRDRSESLPFGPDACVTTALVGAFLDDHGDVVGPAREIGLPGGGPGSLPRVAANAGGDLVVAWGSPSGLHAGPLTDALAVPSASVLSSCPPRGLELESAGDGFWAVWSEACGAPRIRARRMDRVGRPAGRVVEVAGPSGQPGAGVAAAGHFHGGLSVAWVETVGDVGRRVLWARFREDGSQETTPFPVSPGGDAPGTHFAAAPLPDGGVVFAWRLESGRILLRSFDGERGQPAAIAQAAEEAGEREAAPRLTLTPGGLVVAAWGRGFQDPPPRCPARVFDLDLEPLTVESSLGDGCEEPVDLAVSGTGALLATWVTHPDPVVTTCTRAETTMPVLEALPPMSPPIVSSEFPDFRFLVRLGGDESIPRIGVAEARCLPETVCVSGALPGRTEVLLRVVGPKPNGYLWPTVVRFTTSQVEIWIEQVSTGTGRYYRLPGAAPGSDMLDGRFDRQGFRP